MSSSREKNSASSSARDGEAGACRGPSVRLAEGDKRPKCAYGELHAGFPAFDAPSARSAENDDVAVERSVVLRAEQVAKHYRMGAETVRALDGVSFEIKDGEFIAIMGPSGSGKSTMMNLIGALDTPTAGKLFIDGVDISSLSSDRLALFRNRAIGFVFQQFNLLPRTSALRQVMLPLTYADPRPKDAEALARARLGEVGLGDRLDHHPRQLSGGQQQRVAIARALVNTPRILLADEPTGALDSKTSTEIMRLFKTLNANGITVVVVTHEPDVAAFADRRIHFRDGRIVDDIREQGRVPEAAE